MELLKKMLPTILDKKYANRAQHLIEFWKEFKKGDNVSKVLEQPQWILLARYTFYRLDMGIYQSSKS